ncbi:hypothetical protein [Nocardia harenae]|uniref:hypothetical protein n=1 Tax=Nocardia harenae TaxID=358707 RepID=UPI0008326B01|nr:hypothetical protein [Nocardia harenae]
MPKRISDVSLHVYLTPETLDHVVRAVREAVDAHLAERDVFAWRFTLPVDADDPRHAALESRWRADNPDLDPGARGCYEIALSLVGAPAELTDDDIATLEHTLLLALYAVPRDEPEIPFTLSASQRTDVDLDTERERI